MPSSTLSNSWRSIQYRSSSANPLAVSSTTGATALVVSRFAQLLPDDAGDDRADQVVEDRGDERGHQRAPQERRHQHLPRLVLVAIELEHQKRVRRDRQDRRDRRHPQRHRDSGSPPTSSRPIPRKKNRPPHPRQPQLNIRRRVWRRLLGVGRRRRGSGGLTAPRVARRCSRSGERPLQSSGSELRPSSVLPSAGHRRLADVPLADVGRGLAVTQRPVLQQRDARLPPAASARPPPRDSAGTARRPPAAAPAFPRSPTGRRWRSRAGGPATKSSAQSSRPKLVGCCAGDRAERRSDALGRRAIPLVVGQQRQPGSTSAATDVAGRRGVVEDVLRAGHELLVVARGVEEAAGLGIREPVQDHVGDGPGGVEPARIKRRLVERHQRRRRSRRDPPGSRSASPRPSFQVRSSRPSCQHLAQHELGVAHGHLASSPAAPAPRRPPRTPAASCRSRPSAPSRRGPGGSAARGPRAGSAAALDGREQALGGHAQALGDLAAARRRAGCCWCSKLPAGVTSKYAPEQRPVLVAQQRVDLGQGPDEELALLALAVGVLGGVEAAARDRSSRAGRSPASPRRPGGSAASPVTWYACR